DAFYRSYRLGLAAEPTTSEQISGQDSLEVRFGSLMKDVFPSVGNLQVRRLESFRSGTGFRRARLLQLEPIKAVRAECKEIRQLADSGKSRMPEQLNGNHPLVGGEFELDILDEAREIGPPHNNLVSDLANKNEYLAIFRKKKLDGSPPESLVALA